MRAARRSLRARDRDRVLGPDWFQRPDAVGYAAYADRFAGTLNGVAQRVDYLRELGVTYLHLMPLLAPRPGENDGGYAVMDYGRVREDLGTMADLDGAGRDPARQRDLADPGPGAQPRGRRACVGRGGAGRGPEVPGLLLRLPRPHRARRLRGVACRRCSRTSRRATSPGTTTWRAGCGRRSTPGSGTSTGRTRMCCASSSRSSWTWPTGAWTACAWTRSRSSGSGWAPTARTSPRCTRSPRCCAPRPGSRPRA